VPNRPDQQTVPIHWQLTGHHCLMTSRHRPRQSGSAEGYGRRRMYGAVVAGDVGGVTTIVVVDSGGVVVVVGAAVVDVSGGAVVVVAPLGEAAVGVTMSEPDSWSSSLARGRRR